jgi:hypothetical protein
MLWKSKARGTRSGPVMDLFLIEADHPEKILVSGLKQGQADDLRDWFCYTKPIGSDVKIVARPRARTRPGFSVRIAGSDANYGTVKGSSIKE